MEKEYLKNKIKNLNILSKNYNNNEHIAKNKYIEALKLNEINFRKKIDKINWCYKNQKKNIPRNFSNSFVNYNSIKS